jgi:hypothetical protein
MLQNIALTKVAYFLISIIMKYKDQAGQYKLSFIFKPTPPSRSKYNYHEQASGDMNFKKSVKLCVVTLSTV